MQSKELDPYLELDYQALRGEILQCMEFRQKYFEMVVVAAGVFVAAGSQFSGLKPALLLFPFIVLCLSASWSHQGLALFRAARYIRQRFEVDPGREGWETWLGEEILEQENSTMNSAAPIEVLVCAAAVPWLLGLLRKG